MPDWKKIKAEYIRDESSSFRKLAAKYGVSASVLGKRAKRENWSDLRRQKVDKRDTKFTDVVSAREADRLTTVDDVADDILNTIKTKVERGEYAMTPQEIKQLTGALRDIRELKGIKTDADLREQEARIRKLEREAAGETADKDIKVVISGALEEYAK